jgi:succinylglutamic semialdehyde dehydrogenase
MSGGVFIDGVWRSGAGEEAVSIDPTTGETIWREATASQADVAAAVAAARAAFQPWADQPREERIAVLRRYKEILVERTAAFAEALSRETGKALWETKAELGSMAGKVDLSIKAYDERTGGVENVMPFGRAVLRHRAHGVMAVLGPFNFPVTSPTATSCRPCWPATRSCSSRRKRRRWPVRCWSRRWRRRACRPESSISSKVVARPVRR